MFISNPKKEEREKGILKRRQEREIENGKKTSC